VDSVQDLFRRECILARIGLYVPPTIQILHHMPPRLRNVRVDLLSSGGDRGLLLPTRVAWLTILCSCGYLFYIGDAHRAGRRHNNMFGRACSSPTMILNLPMFMSSVQPDMVKYGTRFSVAMSYKSAKEKVSCRTKIVVLGKVLARQGICEDALDVMLEVSRNGTRPTYGFSPNYRN